MLLLNVRSLLELPWDGNPMICHDKHDDIMKTEEKIIERLLKNGMELN
jgi:hypothetical protein